MQSSDSPMTWLREHTTTSVRRRPWAQFRSSDLGLARHRPGQFLATGTGERPGKPERVHSRIGARRIVNLPVSEVPKTSRGVALRAYGSRVARKASRKNGETPRQSPAKVSGPVSLPRRALERIHLGQSFAEYDPYLEMPNVYVQTLAIRAASDRTNPHCFFVGRRGTGKTATTRYIKDNQDNIVVIRPEIFSPSKLPLAIEEFERAGQKPFRSLTSAFKRSLVDEVLFNLYGAALHARSAPDYVRREYDRYGDYDFDIRVVYFIADYLKELATGDDAQWLSNINLTKHAIETLNRSKERHTYTVVLDAIDDSWDGSEQAVLYLTALMHAALEVNTQTSVARILLFLRENIFERVRLFDSEFSRLETCVVGLDWTRTQLIEMIERRINAPLTTKLALGGTTWNAFFENGDEAKTMVLDYCQHRPRDILTYCSLALDNAQGNRHDHVMIEDLQAARRRFSDSRLMDLSDEYQENYPQIRVVLESFYGLGHTFTIHAMEDFLNRLMDDAQVISSCKEWIYEYSGVDRFVRLLYDIGFVGIVDAKSGGKRADPVFRSFGPRDTTPPPINSDTELVIHPSYAQALDLQDVIVGSLVEGQKLRRSGLILELPGALSLDEYRELVADLLEKLKNLPHGRESAAEFENLIGDVLSFCFFRPLTNVEAQVREIDGVVRRDWIASNRANFGFWEMVRTRYDAVQVIFECKNFSDLEASDFHQASYYMTNAGGKFVVLFFRGEIKNHYYSHVKRVAEEKGGIVLLLTERDINVFLRQARNGVTKDDHIQDRYDTTIRSIS